VITDANENSVTTDEVLLTISSNFIVDEVEYQILSDGSLSVVKYHGSAANVTIPEVVNEKTVKEIGEGAFEGNATLVSIDLPDTVTAIRARAFKNCTSLSEMK